ncbi:MAG: hypothetical protein J5759_05635 [Bacteroidales bacterium]|nr:hypothetical protein [Bacteroidales bacterium]
MLRAIRETGIVPFFENAIPGYSIEEMTPPEFWFDGDSDTLGPWDWKVDCVQSGDVAYGKFLWNGKAAFATAQWYRELMNYRRSLPKYEPDAAGRKILDFVDANGSIASKDIRRLLGLKKSGADAACARLQMQCRLLVGDIARVYRGPDLHYVGWQLATFCAPEGIVGGIPDQVGYDGKGGYDEEGGYDGVIGPCGKRPRVLGPGGFPFMDEEEQGPGHSPEESYRLLTAHIQSVAPAATPALVAKMLG